MIKRCPSTLNSHVSFIDPPSVPTNANETFEVMSFSSVLKTRTKTEIMKRRDALLRWLWDSHENTWDGHVHTVKVMLGLEKHSRKDSSCIFARRKPQIFPSYQRSQLSVACCTASWSTSHSLSWSSVENSIWSIKWMQFFFSFFFIDQPLLDLSFLSMFLCLRIIFLTYLFRLIFEFSTSLIMECACRLKLWREKWVTVTVDSQHTSTDTLYVRFLDIQLVLFWYLFT